MEQTSKSKWARGALKFVVVILLLSGIYGVIVMVKAKQFAPGAMPEFPPETVSAAEAAGMEWRGAVRAIGELRAEQGIAVSSEVGGIVRALHFESGDAVEAGALLVELDADVEKAELAAATAALRLAEVELARTRRLVAQATVAEAELDRAIAAADEAAARVGALEARIAQKAIRAPFGGTLGIRRVELGQYVAGGAAMVSLEATEKMKVEFTVPQGDSGKIAVGQALRVRTDAEPGVEYAGEITAFESRVDPATRTLSVEGIVENPHGRLRPGMFGVVETVLPEARAVVGVPQTAVYYQSFGNSVFVVKNGENGQTVEQRFVRLGEQRGDIVEVLKGVEAGEQVVTSGVFKLRNGGRVVIDNQNAPEATLEPQPENS